MSPLEIAKLTELLKLKSSGYLFHRERSDLEFKEQFNFAGWAEYLRDFAAFANNQGGYIIFGIENSPRKPSGLNNNSAGMFERIDQEVISGSINELFSPSIEWERTEFEQHDKKFGVIYIYSSKIKPVIAKKDEGRNQIIKNGEIYYRYAGRTQKIEYAELEHIIQTRIQATNTEWIDLMNKIGKVGPANAAILDTEKGIIEKNQNNVLVLDEGLIDKIKFIREGEFSERKGATTLRLVGEVQPIDQVEVTRVRREKLTDQYPYSYMQLVEIIKQSIPNANTNTVNAIIKDHNMKNNKSFCAYNFRNKQQEERYKNDGVLPVATPSIYNDDALHFILTKLQS